MVEPQVRFISCLLIVDFQVNHVFCLEDVLTLDIQGHLLRFGMTGSPKYTIQNTVHSPEEVFAW